MDPNFAGALSNSRRDTPLEEEIPCLNKPQTAFIVECAYRTWPIQTLTKVNEWLNQFRPEFICSYWKLRRYANIALC